MKILRTLIMVVWFGANAAWDKFYSGCKRIDAKVDGFFQWLG